MTKADIAIPMAPPQGADPRRASSGGQGQARAVADRPGDGPIELGVRNHEDGALVLGRGISFEGTISGASRIVIDGKLESKKLETQNLVIGATGSFRGEAVVRSAEIDGRFEGILQADERLAVLSDGNFVGSARYGSLFIEEGGAISGDFQSIGRRE